MKWLIPLGLGATVAVIIYANRKKTNPAVPRQVNAGTFRSTSPGQPQPPAYRRQGA